jgi:hypothetical protein
MIARFGCIGRKGWAGNRRICRPGKRRLPRMEGIFGVMFGGAAMEFCVAERFLAETRG